MKLHKTSTDSLLLSDFCNLSEEDEVLEIGCGEGYIMSSHPCCSFFLSVDINQEYISSWIKKKKIKDHFFMVADARILPQILKKNFTAVICNPPYYKVESGRISPFYSRAVARHELALKLEDVFAVSRLLLKKKGRLYMIHLFSRLQEIKNLARNYGFNIEEIRPGSSDRKPEQVPEQVLIVLRY